MSTFNECVCTHCGMQSCDRDIPRPAEQRDPSQLIPRDTIPSLFDNLVRTVNDLFGDPLQGTTRGFPTDPESGQPRLPNNFREFRDPTTGQRVIIPTQTPVFDPESGQRRFIPDFSPQAAACFQIPRDRDAEPVRDHRNVYNTQPRSINLGEIEKNVLELASTGDIVCFLQEGDEPNDGQGFFFDNQNDSRSLADKTPLEFISNRGGDGDGDDDGQRGDRSDNPQQNPLQFVGGSGGGQFTSLGGLGTVPTGFQSTIQAALSDLPGGPLSNVTGVQSIEAYLESVSGSANVGGGGGGAFGKGSGSAAADAVWGAAFAGWGF